jgi:hypothetical protein
MLVVEEEELAVQTQMLELGDLVVVDRDLE